MNTQSSAYWTDYYTQNAKVQRIDWEINPKIRHSERAKIVRSLQAWQLGETSEGNHLLRAAHLYAEKINDYLYPVAVTFFIKEEQKHGENLGRYLDLIGEQRIKKDWGDSLFRKIRYFNTSMELWTVAVITVENAAEIYYESLYQATACPLLKSICADILIDEKQHLVFQTERLCVIFNQKPNWVKPLLFLAYGLFFAATACVIWFGHKKVLGTNHSNLFDFLKKMRWKFEDTFGKLFQKPSFQMALR